MLDTYYFVGRIIAEQPLYLGANIINNAVTRFGKMKLSKFSFKYI